MIEALFVIALLGSVVPAQHLASGTPGRPSGRALARPLGWAIVGAAGLLAMAMLLTPGLLAGALAVPWLGVTGVRALGRLPSLWQRRASLRRLLDGLAADAATVYLAVGAGWAVVSRLGFRPLGFEDRIVLLTAVHFHVAGFVLVLAGELLRRRSQSRTITAALTGLVVGIPLTAVGFLGISVVGLIGAWLVSVGGFVIGLGHLRAARRHDVPGNRLAAIAGASLLLSMPLAVAWATAPFLGIPFLPLPAMAAIHGGLNVLGFALPVVHAWTGGR